MIVVKTWPCLQVAVPKDPTWKAWTAHSILDCGILQGIATLVLPTHSNSMEYSQTSEACVARVLGAAPRDQDADLE